MPLPQHITTGFEFDEAIWLAELCQRAHELFTHESETETQTLYDALYAWRRKSPNETHNWPAGKSS